MSHFGRKMVLILGSIICFDQLVFMMQQAGSNSTEEKIRTYIQSIIPIIIQLKRSTNSERFIEIAEIYFDTK